MRTRTLLVLLSLASLVGCFPCPPEFETRTFVIDAPRAAMVLDVEGQPDPAGCRSVCNALQTEAMPTRFSPETGMGDGGFSPLFDVDTSRPVACELVSMSMTLELRCRWQMFVMCYG